MLKNIIKKISNDFIAEAIASPNLLADMAAMEKYMAESYSGRVFVELLQNADDCKSTKIYIKEFNGHILFANNGRPFNENDVISISRSGSSNKKRGESIGYRGIGFKSTTYLTNEIVIYSDNTYFSFSKTLCAKRFAIPAENLPMIRIPLLLDTIDSVIHEEVNRLNSIGYSTVFIFKNANIQEFSQELQQIDTGMFIFLNNIEQCYVDTPQIHTAITLHRYARNNGQIVEFTDFEKSAWYIVKNTNSAIGLKYNLSTNKITACDTNEQLYHSYLPTYDKMLYPIKVNADFSTDPSRKHISIDEKTINAIQGIAQNIVHLLATALSQPENSMLSDIFTIFNDLGAFSRCNSMLKHEVHNQINKTISLELQNQKSIHISEYKLLPEWLDESEKHFLRLKSNIIGKESLNTSLYETYIDIDSFIQNYSSQRFSNDDLISMMSETALVAAMPQELQGKFIGHIIRTSKFEKLTPQKQQQLIHMKVATANGVQSIKQLNQNNDKVSRAVQEGLTSVASKSELNWCSEKKFIDIQKLLSTSQNTQSHQATVVSKTIKPRITKWRSAEQQCMEIEKTFGNAAIDVSIKNMGYDIESTTADGSKRYIEVKSIKEGGSFSITNNEYTAAHQYGEMYYLCLLIQNAQNIQAIYIQNPLKVLSFEKKIKQWEWYCDTYSGTSYIFEI